jgi:hypothetical protein
MAQSQSTTYVDMVLRAIDFFQRTDIWVAIGRTTAWDDDLDPPTADMETGLDTPVVYVRPDDIQLLKPVPDDGDFVDDVGQHYEFVLEEDAITEVARYVYIAAEFTDQGGQPHSTFRQCAIVTNLVTANGYENEPWVAPANVTDIGYVRWIANFEPQSGSSQTVKIPIEFR